MICWLLHQPLLTGLDLLNAAEFEEVNALLGDSKAELTPDAIEQRIRAHTELIVWTMTSCSARNLGRH